MKTNFVAKEQVNEKTSDIFMYICYYKQLNCEISRGYVRFEFQGCDQCLLVLFIWFREMGPCVYYIFQFINVHDTFQLKSEYKCYQIAGTLLLDAAEL